jgi:hypothetical protein
MLIAALGEKDEQLLSSTWSTVRYARRIGRSIYMVLPDGAVTASPSSSPA